ncbi:MAG: DUF5666 domain-containing protein [Ignavibacteriaceae bacterium]|jgi:hypothetical protein
MKKTNYSNRRELRSVVLLLILSLLLGAPQVLKADGNLEVKGSVQVKTETSITVNSIEFLVTASTKISGSMNSGLTYDSVKVGSYVKIEAKSNANGQLEASEIRLMTAMINLELSGKITALSTNSFTLNGSTILVDTNTIIFTQFHAALTFADLKIGDNVLVRASQTISGQLPAVVIMVKTENTHQEIELSGKIQLITDNSVTVLNTQFYVGSSTIIFSRNRGVLNFSDLKVGDDVNVRGFMQQDSSYLALSIKVESNEFEQKDLEVEGVITAATSTTLTVNTVTFVVDSSTVISTHEGTVLYFSDLKIGDKVEIKALLQSDGSYIATRIKLENEESEKEIVVAGLIDVINSDNIVVGDNKIYVDSLTQIYSQSHQKLTFTDLKVGAFIVVKAYLQGGNYLASSIKVKDNSKAESHFTGAIEAINGSSITVKGLVFVTDQNTEFLDENRNTISINDLKVGQIISVEAQLQSGNQYIALKVIARNFWRPTVIVEGSIENLTLTSITVMGKTFAVDSSTLVVGHGSGVLTFVSLTVGLNVEVKGSLTTNGVLTAKLIKVHPEHEFKIYGKIDSFTGTNFLIGDLTISTDLNTVYYDGFDNVATFDSLKVNQFVEVSYVKTNLNENLAVKVEIESDPHTVKFDGVVTSADSNNIQLSVPAFSVSSNTLFMTSTYTQTQSSSIQTGQSVTVWAVQGQNGSLSAIQVQQLTGSATAINGGHSTSLPNVFELKQNYPNPFNPSTEITFMLAKQEQVSLVVYNMIGQQVAMLINGPQSAGSHVVKFNSADLPSGVYLYRLQAGSFGDVKKMILIK